MYPEWWKTMITMIKKEVEDGLQAFKTCQTRGSLPKIVARRIMIMIEKM